MGLLDVVEIEPLVAAGGFGRRGEGGPPAGQLALVDEEVELAAVDAELDAVAAADEAQGASGRRLGAHVEDHGAEGRAAHAGVGYPDHVLESRELLRDR